MILIRRFTRCRGRLTVRALKKLWMTKIVVKTRANINAKDGNGCALLHIALRGNAPKAVKILIEAGANLDAIDKYGNTPIDHAKRSKNWGVFQILRAAGAHCNNEC